LDDEVGDLAVLAGEVCGHDAALIEVHRATRARRVPRENGVGSVVCPRAASTVVAASRPLDVGVDVRGVGDEVDFACPAAVGLVSAVSEVDEVGVGQVEEVVHEMAEDVSAWAN